MKFARSMLGVSVAAIALFAGRAQAADPQDCGLEGLKPCSDGCQAKHLPKEALPSADWYPIGDNYVVAPKAYAKRQTPGRCTRCGNLYEPACEGKLGEPLCFAGMYSQETLIMDKDGLCIPEEQQYGCGTHGKPLCPPDLVNQLGTISLLRSPAQGNPWQIFPVFEEREGCIWSAHNPNLRFIKAPKDWLPASHECAEVCVHCGHTGEPACPVAPHCRRRRSLLDPYEFMDGPTFELKDKKQCQALPCGSDTYVEALPACPKDVINKLAHGADAANDGCADPYNIDDKGLCSIYGNINKNSFSKLEQLERLCENPNERVLTKELADLLERANHPSPLKVGQCAQCGRELMVPCDGSDFGGCYANEGFILSKSSGLCVLAACGGTGSADDAAAPWGSEYCNQAIPEYVDPDADPVNRANDCTYFHNKDENGPAPKCIPCGWPGHACKDECEYTIQWNAVGLPEYNVGTYRIRGDLRSKGHCAPLPQLDIYPGKCANPYATAVAATGKPESEAVGHAVYRDANGVEHQYTTSNAPATIAPADSTDPTFGTADNQDTCQRDLADVSVVYLDTCPDGGSPVPKYGQCGGKDWSGPTCCFGYSVCVAKNEYFHQCEDANIPAGFIPWHMACDPDVPSKSACELGSLCRRRQGRSYCEPVPDMVLVQPGSAGCGGGKSAAGAVGITFLVLGLLALCGVGAFVLYKRNGNRMPNMPNMPKMPNALQRRWDARAYVSAANGGSQNGFRKHGKDGSVDISEVNESQTLSMEDSAADEFIDMRVPTERAPMMAHVPRSAAPEGMLSVSSRGPGEGVGEGAGFGGGFGGGGGSGIGRGGIGRVMRPGSGRNSSGRNLGAHNDKTIL